MDISYKYQPSLAQVDIKPVGSEWSTMNWCRILVILYYFVLHYHPFDAWKARISTARFHMVYSIYTTHLWLYTFNVLNIHWNVSMCHIQDSGLACFHRNGIKQFVSSPCTLLQDLSSITSVAVPSQDWCLYTYIIWYTLSLKYSYVFMFIHLALQRYAANVCKCIYGKLGLQHSRYYLLAVMIHGDYHHAACLSFFRDYQGYHSHTRHDDFVAFDDDYLLLLLWWWWWWWWWYE